MWREVPIDEFRDKYLVSDDGKVYSKHTNKCLSPKVSRVGYLRITLSNIEKNARITIGIHRLVAMAFVPNPYGKPTVNHINEIKTDNRSVNLEWATNAEQNAYGTRTERAMSNTDWAARSLKMDYKSIAKKHDYTKPTMCNRMPVIVFRNGERVGEFQTQKDAAEYCGVSKGKVSTYIKTGKSCKGYTFSRK